MTMNLPSETFEQLARAGSKPPTCSVCHSTSSVEFGLDNQTKKLKCDDCAEKELNFSPEQIEATMIRSDEKIMKKMDPMFAQARMHMRNGVRKLFIENGNDAKNIGIVDFLEHTLWLDAGSFAEYFDHNTLQDRLNKATQEMQENQNKAMHQHAQQQQNAERLRHLPKESFAVLAAKGLIKTCHKCRSTTAAKYSLDSKTKKLNCQSCILKAIGGEDQSSSSPPRKNIKKQSGGEEKENGKKKKKKNDDDDKNNDDASATTSPEEQKKNEDDDDEEEEEFVDQHAPDFARPATQEEILKLDPTFSQERMKMRILLRKSIQPKDEKDPNFSHDGVEEVLWCDAPSLVEYADMSTLEERVNRAAWKWSNYSEALREWRRQKKSGETTSSSPLDLHKNKNGANNADGDDADDESNNNDEVKGPVPIWNDGRFWAFVLVMILCIASLYEKWTRRPRY